MKTFKTVAHEAPATHLTPPSFYENTQSMQDQTYLTEAQRQSLVKATSDWISRANRLFDCNLPPIDVHFNLSGRTSGMFCVKGKLEYIRYNDAIFAQHFAPSFNETVPHEVAHYVVHKLYGRRAKPHGKEWKAVMAAFGVAAEVRCNLDLSNVNLKQLKRFTYRCECSEHSLTSIRHNRIQRGEKVYLCRKCRQPLTPVTSKKVER